MLQETRLSQHLAAVGAAPGLRHRHRLEYSVSIRDSKELGTTAGDLLPPRGSRVNGIFKVRQLHIMVTGGRFILTGQRPGLLARGFLWVSTTVLHFRKQTDPNYGNDLRIVAFTC